MKIIQANPAWSIQSFFQLLHRELETEKSESESELRLYAENAKM